MKRLSQHILSLLRHYDSVVLPGIGVFRVINVPAEIDNLNLTLSPPHKEVVFSEFNNIGEEVPDSFSELLCEDIRLVDSYITKERLSSEDAWKILSADLSEFKSYLSFGGNPVLREFNMLNAPLPRLSISPLFESSLKEEVYEKHQGEKKHINSKPFRNSNYYYIPVHKKFANIAVCFLLVCVVALVAVMPIGSSGNSKSTASILPISVSEKSWKSDPQIYAYSQEEFPVAPDGKKSVIHSEEEIFQDTRDNGTHKYFAIVAAFKSEQEANKYIASCEGDPHVFNIVNHGNLYLVSVESASDKSDLEINIPRIRADYPDTWILSLD